MKQTNLNEMMLQIRDMAPEDRKNLVEQILKSLTEVECLGESCNDMVAKNTSGRPNCPHCGAKAEDEKVVRRGYNRNGAQRFYCKECGKFFVPSTGTALAHTHKDADTWRSFIEMTIRGEPLKACAAECKIAYQTAFTWRHKILNVFNASQQSTMMDGIVEADEMLFNMSFKGNRVGGKFGARRGRSYADGNIPRESLERGTDNKSASAKDKVCVFCMVENGDKQFFSAVPGTGFMSETMLKATLPHHVNKDSALMLVDQYKVTRNYLDQNSYKSLVLASNTSDNPHDHKPEIQGQDREKHMQHINAMHRHIRNFLKPYFGVSSKYLANYISMYVWFRNYSIQRRRQEGFAAAEKCISQSNCYITGREIMNMPLVPSVA